MVKCFIFLCLYFVYLKADSVSVMTSKGEIRGNVVNRSYKAFFGVPYANVNPKNPFGASLEYSNIGRSFYAKNSTIMCPQVYFNDGGVLQCLRLNIYVPLQASVTSLMPILVWFHGGGFTFGSAGEYGGQYLVKHDILVITVNYRLGAYGFLCLDDPLVTGNQGLKDQIAALRWIKQEIFAFGGDPDRITIAGESYGGGGVDLHLYSKYETLFHKAIIQSGSMYVTEGIFVKPDYLAAIKLANYLGNNITTNKEALRVLASENPIDVNTATRELNMTLTLCKEKTFNGVPNFITEDPFHLYNPSRIKKIPIMIGYTSQEMLYEFVNKPESFYDDLGNPFTNQLDKTFVLKKRDREKLSRIIENFYLGGQPIGPESQLELSNFLSDFAINYGVEWSVNRYVEQGAKVFKYLFSYTGASDYNNVTGSGAMHTEELKYLFDWVWATPLREREQWTVRKRMTQMWANFVKYGNPTPELTPLLPVTWPPIKGTDRPYLDINIKLEVKQNVFKHRLAFWQLFWHIYLKKHVLLN